MSAAQTTKKPFFLGRQGLWRALQAYLIGCALAAFWAAVRFGGAPATIPPDYSGPPIPPTIGDQIGFYLFLLAFAVLGCLLPVVLGRILMASRNLRSRGWFAAIWGFAGALVAAGFNPMVLINPIEGGVILLNFALPGAIIGVIVHAIEFRGDRDGA